MKTLFLVTVLAVLSASNDAAVIQGGAVFRSNLYVGYINPGDRLLYRNYFYRAAVPNTIQYQDVTFNGNYSTRITYIQATEIGYTQWANAYVLSGGLGARNATVRLSTAKGYGYYYQLEFWGR